MFSRDTDEEHFMHSKSDNKEIMINDKTDTVIKKIFRPIVSRYQIGLKTTMKGSNFAFDYVDLLYCKCHKISLNRGGFCIDSPHGRRKQKSNSRCNQ